MKKMMLVILVVLCGSACAAENGLVSWWKFDDGGSEKTIESVSGKECEVRGNIKYVEGVSGTALRFDGFTTRVVQNVKDTRRPGAAMTFEVWVAAQVYPWNWTAIVNQEREHKSGYFFGIDGEGHVGLAVNLITDGQWHMCESNKRIDLLKWTHVAGTVDIKGGLKVYINGEEVGSLSINNEGWDRSKWIKQALGVDVVIGKSHTQMSPKYSERRPSREAMSNMMFDGLIDELKIYDRALSAAEIKEHYGSSIPKVTKPLRWRVMPSGPDGVGRFGAYYTRLDYAEEWEKIWRVGEHSDILVRFDEMPIKGVFWRGTNYGLCWVSENGLWMGDQSVEANYNTGCNEHMSDKQCRFSSVRIIEDNDARVKIHWRYAVSGIDYSIVNTDETGWGDWVDEYYVMYPDGVSTRHWVYWTSMYEKPRHLQFQETIFFNQPGMMPEDTVELEALSLANMDGESHTYSWADGPPERYRKPANALIQVTNFRSKYRPFIIFEPGCRIKRFGSHNPLSHFTWWNHWPVGQLPNDGRVATGVDRPSHSSITSSDLVIRDGEGLSHEAVVLCGMTEKKAGELALLARSWNYPAEMKIKSDAFSGGSYDRYQRAYVLEGSGAELKFMLAGSEKSPVVNPAFVVENWGEVDAVLKVNGKSIKRGKDFRFGHRHRLEGTDLVVWVKRESVKPIEIVLSRVGE